MPIQVQVTPETLGVAARRGTSYTYSWFHRHKYQAGKRYGIGGGGGGEGGWVSLLCPINHHNRTYTWVGRLLEFYTFVTSKVISGRAPAFIASLQCRYNVMYMGTRIFTFCVFIVLSKCVCIWELESSPSQWREASGKSRIEYVWSPLQIYVSREGPILDWEGGGGQVVVERPWQSSTSFQSLTLTCA